MTKALLSDAIDDFLVLRASQDYSKGTLANERTVLKRFLVTVGNVWVHSIGENQVTRYFEDAGKTRAPQTLQSDHTTLGLFFDWARKTKRMPMGTDPMFGRRRPKRRKKERNRIHVSRFPHLLDTAEAIDPRDRAVVAVLLYTLVRENEASDMRIGDLDLDAGFLTARITKSHTEDRMPVCAELDAELRRWLTIYSAQAKRPLRQTDYLLPARHSNGIVRTTGGRIEGHVMSYVPDQRIARLGRVAASVLNEFGFEMTDHAGRSKREGAHTIRRSGARALFDQLAECGYDHSLRIVQSLLHHASVSQTEAYVGITADRRSRDEILRGQMMFPAVENDNVLHLSV